MKRNRSAPPARQGAEELGGPRGAVGQHIADALWRKQAENDRLEREKLRGVIEMAGAVCHEMNQPLQELFLLVDDLRESGEAVGLVKIRIWRPFPFQDLRKALAGADLVIVCDRALSLGGAAGPVLAEVRSALYPLAQKPAVLGYTIGLGGRDVQPEAFKEVVRLAQAEAATGPSEEFFLFGVRS